MNNAIGIFDSGVGGLTVWKEIRSLLPNESILYYADSANCPYGEKSQNEIIKLSTSIVDFFLDYNVKLVVVACNTATAAAIKYLREAYSIPFVGMEPAVKPAAEQTKTGKVGILATPGTLVGNHYLNTKSRFAKGVEVIETAGLGLVELVESNLYESSKASDLIKTYVEPMISEGVDHLVLGCTHYPFYSEVLKSFLPKHIKVINPAIPVANQVKRVLQEENKESESKNPDFKFFSTGDVDVIKRLLGDNLPSNSILKSI